MGFLTSKFDGLEKEREEKDELINSLQIKVSSLKGTVMQIEEALIIDRSRFRIPTTIQTLHVYSTLKRRGNERFHVVSTWNTRGVFVGNIGFWFGSFVRKCVFNFSALN